MNFSLAKSVQVLQRTPAVISALLANLDEEWTTANEGENTWSPKEVVAHLILCEQSNWIVRAKIILADSPNRTFVPIDMSAHFDIANRHSLQELLDQFAALRKNSLDELNGFQLDEKDLMKTAIHPKLGEVNLQQLLATWVSHDLTHIVQIARVMAKQNKDHVGPFDTFLRIMKS